MALETTFRGRSAAIHRPTSEPITGTLIRISSRGYEAVLSISKYSSPKMQTAAALRSKRRSDLVDSLSYLLSWLRR